MSTYYDIVVFMSTAGAFELDPTPRQTLLETTELFERIRYRTVEHRLPLPAMIADRDAAADEECSEPDQHCIISDEERDIFAEIMAPSEWPPEEVALFSRQNTITIPETPAVLVEDDDDDPDIEETISSITIPGDISSLLNTAADEEGTTNTEEHGRSDAHIEDIINNTTVPSNLATLFDTPPAVAESDTNEFLDEADDVETVMSDFTNEASLLFGSIDGYQFNDAELGFLGLLAMNADDTEAIWLEARADDDTGNMVIRKRHVQNRTSTDLEITREDEDIIFRAMERLASLNFKLGIQLARDLADDGSLWYPSPPRQRPLRPHQQ